MKKDLRRQIKQDEFKTGIDKAWTFLGVHKEEARITVIALAVVGVLAGGLSYLQSRKAHEAQSAFSEAFTVFETPVAGTQPTAGASFRTADEKYKKAAAGFDGVARRYPGHPLALRARYYAGLCRIELGSLDEAERELQGVAAVKEPGGLTPALARMAVADLLRRRGRLDQAVEAYRLLANETSLPIPREYALWNMAATLEDEGRMSDAAAAYREIVEQFPGSVFAPDAQRLTSYLTGGSREG